MGQFRWLRFSFTQVASSGFRRNAVLFGDFDGDGTTDVFGVGNSSWQVSYSPKSMLGATFSQWTPLQAAPANPVDGLIVADFKGNGFAGVAFPCGSGAWQIYYGDTKTLSACKTFASFSLVAGLAASAEVLAQTFWSGTAPTPKP